MKKGRSQWPRGLRRRSVAARLLRMWVRTHRGHGCLSVVSVVCCHVGVSTTSRYLVQRSPTVVCRVWFRHLVNEEALAYWGILEPKKKDKKGVRRRYAAPLYNAVTLPPSFLMSAYQLAFCLLTPILLTWRIGWDLNNASKWQMWFNLGFKGLKKAMCQQRTTNDTIVSRLTMQQTAKAHFPTISSRV